MILNGIWRVRNSSLHVLKSQMCVQKYRISWLGLSRFIALIIPFPTSLICYFLFLFLDTCNLSRRTDTKPKVGRWVRGTEPEDPSFLPGRIKIMFKKVKPVFRFNGGCAIGTSAIGTGLVRLSQIGAIETTTAITCLLWKITTIKKLFQTQNDKNRNHLFLQQSNITKTWY